MVRNDATVYIIDDDPAFLYSLEMLLDCLGLRVRAFDSAREFLQQYDADGRGCIVLDVSMRDMSGPELWAHLRSLGDSIPIIFVSGRGGADWLMEALRSDREDFLLKPFNGDTLVSRIDAMLSASQRMHTSSIHVRN